MASNPGTCWTDIQNIFLSELELLNAMHITTSVYFNDGERGLLGDYEDWLKQLAPHEPVSHYHQNRTVEENADAHLK